jgi:Uncharacterised nucleotidyltransferase
MATTLPELFRTLASFSPRAADLGTAPWEDYVDWALGQGLASMAAYNLEYRLATGGAPDWVRDRLLAVHQGAANDVVMKLVNFKRAVDALEGRRVILLGAASFAESLYPHVAFRPVSEIEVLLPKRDVDGFANFLGHSDFRPQEDAKQTPHVARVLSDTRTTVLLYGGLLGDVAEDEALFMRALPMAVFGPSIRRLDLEDALLVQVLSMARAGFEVPMIDFVDLRELVSGASAVGGVYARLPDPDLIKRRANAWKLDRALWAALAVVGRLFPEVSSAAERLSPDLLLPTREVLNRLVVEPLSAIGRTREFAGAEKLRAVLAGASYE